MGGEKPSDKADVIFEADVEGEIADPIGRSQGPNS